MEVAAALPANIINLSSKPEKTLSSSQTYYNVNGEALSSVSGNHNFVLMDSLFKAAIEGDIHKFKEHASILDRLVSPNENTILHVHITARPQTAKRNSFWEICLKSKPDEGIHRNGFVKDILELCPDLLWKANRKGETLLHMAARHGHADIVKLLIDECKKKPDHQNIDPEKGDEEGTRRMLGMINEAKDTALHEAVRYNHVDVVKILTKEDPNLSYDANNAGETPLYLAAERGYKHLVEHILFNCKSPPDYGPMGRTALHAAVFCNDIEMTKVLLDYKGTLTGKPDQQEWLPLHLAAHFGYNHILRELLNTDKSSAYKADNEGKTALHIAASRGKVDVMQELILSCPGCCELVDKRGWNVFHFALNSKNRNAVQLLLNSPLLGNLINEKNDEGNTPLLQLAASGDYMKSFVCHPKVDKLAFNHQNQNAANIILSNFLIWPREVSFLRYLRSVKGKCGRRQIVPRGEKRKVDEGNIVCNKSINDGNEKKRRHEALENYMMKGKDSHLIVAALIETVTFTAGITLPGGYIDEKGPYLGSAALTRNRAFQAFVIFNTIAMIFSTCAVYIHLFVALMKNKRKEFEIWHISMLFIMFAMLAMVLAFLMGTYAVLYRAKELAISACVIGGLFFLVYAYFKPLEHLRNIVTKLLVSRLARKLKYEFKGIRSYSITFIGKNNCCSNN